MFLTENNTSRLKDRKMWSIDWLLSFALLLSLSTTAWSLNSGQPTQTLVNTVSVQADGSPVFLRECEDQILCNKDLNCRPLPIDFSVENSSMGSEIEVSYRIDFENRGSFGPERPVNANVHDFPVGVHRVEWIARHQGKISKCSYRIIVKDCQTPIAQSINGKSLTLKTDQKDILLHTSDINLFSTDNCAVTELKIFTPSRGPGQLQPPKGNGKTIRLTREDLGKNSIDLWVKDEAGNWSYTTTYIHLSKQQVIKPKDVESIYMDLQGVDKRSPRLEMEKTELAGKLILFQNEPNPFGQSTTIRFYLSKPGTATFELMDASGKIIKRTRADYGAGLHKIQLNAIDLQPHNLLIYRLSTRTDVATKKMLRKGA